MLPLCLMVLVTAQQVPPADELAEVAPPAKTQPQSPLDALFLLPLTVMGVSASAPAFSAALLLVAAGAAAIIAAATLLDSVVGCAGTGAGVLVLPLFMVLANSMGACPYPLLFSLALAPLAAFLGVVAAMVGVHRLHERTQGRSEGLGAVVGALAAASAFVTVSYPVAMVAWGVAAVTILGSSFHGHTTNAQLLFACTFGPVVTVAAWTALNGLGLLGGLLAWLSTREATSAVTPG